MASSSPDLLSLLPLLQKIFGLLREHNAQLAREQPSAINALSGFLTSLLSSEKAAPEVLAQALAILVFLKCSLKSCEALFAAV